MTRIVATSKTGQIYYYNSVAECSEELGFTPPQIRYAINTGKPLEDYTLERDREYEEEYNKSKAAFAAGVEERRLQRQEKSRLAESTKLRKDMEREQRRKEKEEYAKGVEQRKMERAERKRQLDEEKEQRREEREIRRQQKEEYDKEVAQRREERLQQKEIRRKQKEEYDKEVAQRKEERAERKRQLEEEKEQRKIEREKAREAKLAEQRHIQELREAKTEYERQRYEEYLRVRREQDEAKRIAEIKEYERLYKMNNEEMFDALNDRPGISYVQLENGSIFPDYYINPNDPDHQCVKVIRHGITRPFESKLTFRGKVVDPWDDDEDC